MLSPHTTLSVFVPSPRTGRAALIGHNLRRELSCLLVLTLLLLSAVTFSTDKIPNFNPDCKTHSALKIKSASAVAVVSCLSESSVVDTSPTVVCPTFSASVTPLVEWFSLATSSRGPPVFLPSFIV
jgi:hypothetical protein